jgi:drug/metabolite transporter (DMT)-like permease
LALLFGTWPIAFLVLALTLVCSLFAFLTMNRWQPDVDATSASIIYCTEPLSATAFALFLPTLLSQFTGVYYLDETFTRHLLIGGGLILVANVIIALRPPQSKHEVT